MDWQIPSRRILLTLPLLNEGLPHFRSVKFYFGCCVKAVVVLLVEDVYHLLLQAHVPRSWRPYFRVLVCQFWVWVFLLLIIAVI